MSDDECLPYFNLAPQSMINDVALLYLSKAATNASYLKLASCESSIT